MKPGTPSSRPAPTAYPRDVPPSSWNCVPLSLIRLLPAIPFLFDHSLSLRPASTLVYQLYSHPLILSDNLILVKRIAE
ncbi:hypothetical protein IG631_10304 [Alternaria alternata]|nr:hypothetical protein IG631_10304 [Alternaria alternata]